MSPTAVLERPADVSVEAETQADVTAFDEALAVFPETLSEMTLEEIIDVRERVVDVLVSRGVTTREQIDEGESHARKAGVIIDNATLLQDGAHEIKNGEVQFSDGVIQQVFDNWQTRIGEATALAGDSFKVQQKVGEDGQQIETAFGGSIDMMLRGLDMNIELAKKDSRFLSELQSSLSDVRTEVSMTSLIEKYPDREFVVFQTRPYAHTMLQKAGEDFVKRRHFSDNDEKTAMHFSFKIGGGSRSMMQTMVNGDNLEIWDEVYGDKVTNDIDRLDSLMIVDVTDRNIDHAEVHVLSVANIDEVQSRQSGEVTHAGVAIGTAEQRQALYDQAIEQARQTDANALDNAHKLTQLSIEIAESILTGKMSEGIVAGIADALAAKTSKGEHVLGAKQRELFEDVLATGKLNELAASALQELTILQESAKSTTDTDRLASLLGAEQAAEVLAGKSIERATLDAFAEGKRAGGCPGAYDETVEQKIQEARYETQPNEVHTAWYDQLFNDREIAQMKQIERSIVEEQQFEQENNLYKILYEAIEADDLEQIRQLFAIEAHVNSDYVEEYSEELGQTRNVLVFLNMLTKNSEDFNATEREKSSRLTKQQTEKIISILNDVLADELTLDNGQESFAQVYSVWLGELLRSELITAVHSPENQESLMHSEIVDQHYSQELEHKLNILEKVTELVESSTKLEDGLNDLLEQLYKNLLSAAESSDDETLIAELIEKLADPVKRQEFAHDIAVSMKEIDEQLAIDLLLEQISPETEILLNEILSFNQNEREPVFTNEEIQVISMALQEGVLNEKAVMIIRKYILFVQLEPLIADESVRARLVNSPQALSLLQIAKDVQPENILAYLSDRLVSSKAMPFQTDDRSALVRKVGIFAVAGYRFDYIGLRQFDSLEQANENPLSGQLVFA